VSAHPQPEEPDFTPQQCPKAVATAHSFETSWEFEHCCGLKSVLRFDGNLGEERETG